MNMARHPLGVRSRLLITIAAVVALALCLATLGFNLLLGQSLDADARSLAQARASVALSAIDVRGGRVTLNDAPDDGAIDARVWIFGPRGELEAPPGVSHELSAAASNLAGGPARVLDVEGTRLFAEPIVSRGRRVGAVVAGVDLAPYHQTQRTALIGSIAFVLVLFVLVILAARWLLTRALRPVVEMTQAAVDWSEHDATRRFARGRPHDELTLLASTLDGLLDRLAASLRREQRFSAEISHELRTPLARIHAEVELALRRTRRPQEYRDALEAVRRSAVQMTRAVDALVAAARHEATGERGACDAGAAISSAIEAARPAENGVFAPQVDLPRASVRVGVEADIVERILTPLLENAQRYGRGAVRVSVAHRNGTVLFTVADDGPGVGIDEVESIFEPGLRGAASAGSAGAGLGLALARRLARACGGDVSAEPAGSGLFHVRLPGS